MFGSRIGFVGVLLLAMSGLSLPASAAETVPGDQSLVGNSETQPEAVPGSDTASPPPRSPLRLSTIDYQDAGDKPGKLSVAGVALPGKELYLFLDDQPFTNTLPDESGNWSVESEIKLSDGRHTFRADQYDQSTQMLAARAMITFERAKEPTQEGAAPAEPPTPNATTP
jgi:hypothetical protein